MPERYVLPNTFVELAQDLVDGESGFHNTSKHEDSECVGWQKGIEEFAAYLDQNGYVFQQILLGSAATT